MGVTQGQQQWEKGQSGNPNGRPLKGLGIARLLSAKGDEIAIDPKTDKPFPDGRTKREWMIDRLYNHALTADMNPGTIRAIEIILEREYGKALEHVSFDRTYEDPPSAQELRVLLRLREKEENDNEKGDPAGDRAA